MNEQDLMNDYNALTPEQQVEMHERVIKGEQEHVNRAKLLKKLQDNKDWVEFIDEWLLKDEVIRVSMLHGTIQPRDEAAKCNIQAIKDQTLMFSLFNEKLMSVLQRGSMAEHQIKANKEAIDEIYRVAEEDANTDTEEV